jgi:hypothetical protein
MENKQTTILLVCFDINSTHEENVKQDNNSHELMESPIRIFNDFFSNHHQSKMEVIPVNQSETKYSFSLNLQENTLFEIMVINDLSFIHEISLNAEAYLIFLNLEDTKTEEKLEYLVRYIMESCCAIEVKTYIVGMYKDKNKISINKDDIECLCQDHNLNYEYKTIHYIENEKEHNCIYQIIENKGNDKQDYIKKNEGMKFHEIIERIMINIYEIKTGCEFDFVKNKFNKKLVKGMNESYSRCNIF